MATTWQWPISNSIVIGKDDNLTISKQEVIDGVPGKIYTSSKLHKKYPILMHQDDIKAQVLADRGKKSEGDVIKASIDLTKFETYINT